MRTRLIAVVSIAVLLVGGGSAAGASVSSFTKKSACDLISEDDVTGIFGEAPTQTTEDGKKGKFTTCTWMVPTPEGSSATVFIGIDKPNALNKKDFKGNSKSSTAEKVAGIKKGFIDGITVTFIQNGNFVNVQYLAATGEATNTDGLIALAKALYKKL